MGTLFLVSSPIGNLRDLSFRAVETLAEVDLVLAEDTRKTGLLLKHLNLSKPQLSYFEYNETERIPEIIVRLKNQEKIALISNAGTPTVSDPGYKLVRECIANKLPVVSIPGPSAIITALTASGLPTDRFLYLGFLPRKENQKRTYLTNLLKSFADFPMTFIVFESPFRLCQTLEIIAELLPTASVAVAREMTKIHEEYIRGNVTEVLVHFREKAPKGEITLVFHQ